MKSVSRGEKSMYVLYKEKDQLATSFTNKNQHAISFMKKKSVLQGKKSIYKFHDKKKTSCNKLHEQKSAQNKFQEHKSARNQLHVQNQFHDEKNQITSFPKRKVNM